jgi:hypothetical protein
VRDLAASIADEELRRDVLAGPDVAALAGA